MVDPSGNQDEAILRVTAYHRLDFEMALLKSPDREHAPIRSSISQPFDSTALDGLGTLDSLPPELLRMVYLELDISSCLNLRQTNRRAREFVSNMVEYRAVAQHALETLRAVLRTGIYPHVKVSNLYKALCTRGCTVCDNEFGGFLFLPTTTRCCYPCINEPRDLQVFTVAGLAKEIGVREQKFRHILPVLRTLPGVYTMTQRTRKARHSLVSHPDAISALGKLGFSDTSAASMLSKIRSKDIDTSMVSTSMPLFDPITGEVQYGVCCKGCQIVIELGIDRSDDKVTRRDRIYSKEGYLDHFPTFPQSLKLWETSKHGTIAVKEPEFTRRCGFMDHRLT